MEKLSPKPIRTLDILIYDSSERKLLKSRRLTFRQDSACLYALQDSLSGRKSGLSLTVAAIANLPMQFNLPAVENFGSLELARMNFLQDNMEYPVMSGWSVTDASDEVAVSLLPLMSTITVRSVSNMLESRISDPRIWLEDVNSDAEILRSNGFRPTETIDSCMFAALPNDIGRYTQYPGTTLHCYPNDYPDGIGTPGTKIILEFEYDGKTARHSGTIPPFSRASKIFADICLQRDSVCSFDWIIQKPR